MHLQYVGGTANSRSQPQYDLCLLYVALSRACASLALVVPHNDASLFQV
jgi:hypothetical protein